MGGRVSETGATAQFTGWHLGSGTSTIPVGTDANDILWWRGYYYKTANPTQFARIFGVYDAGGTQLCHLRQLTDGTLRFANQGNTLVGTASSAVPSNQPFRLEIEVVYGGNNQGYLEARVWWTDIESTSTPDTTAIATNVTMSGTGTIPGITQVRTGIVTAPVSMTWDLWFDDVAYALNTGWIGPGGFQRITDSDTAFYVMTPQTNEVYTQANLYDDFNRSATNSWNGGPLGTARAGDWILDNGSATEVQLPNNLYATMAPATNTKMKAGVNTSNVTDIYGSFKVNALPTAVQTQGWVMVRYQDQSNHYLLQIAPQTNGALMMQLEKVVAGTPTSMGGGQRAVTAAGGYNAGDEYAYHISIDNAGNYIARVWPYGTAEPTGTTQASDTTNKFAIDTGSDTTWLTGDVALGHNKGSGNNTITSSWGQMYVNSTFVTGTAYTDANTASYVLTGSATEIHEIPDAGVANYVLTASAQETHEIPDSATGAWVMTAGTVSEVHTIFDSATGAYVLTAGGTDTAQYVDSTTASYVLTGSGTDVAAYVDSTTGQYVMTASTVSEVHTIFDAATGAYVMTAGGTDVEASVDSNTAAYVLTTSATEVHEIPDSATASYVLTGSATVEQRQSLDAATGLWVFVASAADIAAFVDSTTGSTTYTASGTDIAQYVDSNTAAYILVASTVFEEHATYDSNTGAYVLTASAAEVHEIPDSATGAWVMTASASEIYSPASFDAATASYVLTGSATSEVHTIFDTGTGAWILTASATELHTIFDAATASSIYTAGGSETYGHTDSVTASWTMTASASVTGQLVDATTASFVYTGIPVDEQYGKIDQDTGSFVFSASGTEFHELADVGLSQFFLTAITTQEELWQDSDTAVWVLAASGDTSFIPDDDGDLAFFTYVTTGAETVDFVDAAEVDTAFFVFNPSGTEHVEVLDYYLTATQSKRWAAVQVGHFLAAQTHQWVTTQSRRWSVVYRGRGFLNG
jgi:hypothetical protein